MGNAVAQQFARDITGTAWQLEGDLHAYCDLYGAPAGQLAERIGYLSGLIPAVAMDILLNGTPDEIYAWIGAGVILRELTTSPAGIFEAGQGYLQTPGNLLTYSQDFTNAAWTKSFSSVTPGRPDPYGGNGATDVFETTANNLHDIEQTPAAITSGAPYTVFAIVKDLGRGYFGLYENGTIKGKFFSLPADGSGSVLGALVAEPAGASIASIGGGWYLAVINVTSVSTVLKAQVLTALNATTFNYIGDVTKGVTVYRVGAAAGTYTASQLLAMGGIPLTTSAAVPAVYTDAHLYTAGADGAYIYRYASGNYTLADGSTGYSAVDGPVGLVLDGAGSVGSELSPTFGSTLTASSTTDMPTLVVGATYRVSATVVKVSGTQIDIGVQNTAYGWQAGTPKTITANGTALVDYFFVASDTVGRISALYTSAVGTVTLLSCKQVTGIHATQATTANKPTERRGLLNLINRSDDLTNAAWQVQLTAGKSGQTLTLPAADDRITNTLYAGPAAGAYTFAATLSGSGTVSLLGYNATDGNFGITRITLTSTPTLYVTNMTATAANTTPFIWRRSATSDTATSVLVGSCGFFQGTLTAQQILDSGGIPLTTSAAASNATAGRYWLSYGGDDSLALGSVPFQTSDNYAMVAACVNNNASDFPGLIGVEGTSVDYIGIGFAAGKAQHFLCAGGVSQSRQSGPSYTGLPTVVSGRRVGNSAVLRVNGVQSGAALDVSGIGSNVMTASKIGVESYGGAADYLEGAISVAIAIKGTLSDADMLTLERFAASTLPNAPSF